MIVKNDIDYGYNRLRTYQLTVPLLLEWQPTFQSNRKFYLSAGLVGCFNVYTSYKYSDPTRDNVKRSDKDMNPDFFLSENKRGLGDTANDMKLYGSKLYIVVNVSSQIEVMDAATGKSLKQIPFFAENGTPRQPRYVAFADGNAYVCSFDGTLSRIDTTSLAVTGRIT